MRIAVVSDIHSNLTAFRGCAGGSARDFAGPDPPWRRSGSWRRAPRRDHRSDPRSRLAGRRGQHRRDALAARGAGRFHESGLRCNPGGISAASLTSPSLTQAAQDFRSMAIAAPHICCSTIRSRHYTQPSAAWNTTSTGRLKSSPQAVCPMRTGSPGCWRRPRLHCLSSISPCLLTRSRKRRNRPSCYRPT